MKKRDRLYKTMKKSRDLTHIKTYKKCKQHLQKKQRQAYWSYVNNIITPQQSDTAERTTSKRLWTFIKHKKKDNSSITGLRDKGQLYSDTKSKANILNQQFQSVFTKSPDISTDVFQNGNYVGAEAYPSAPEIFITCNGVQRLLEQLNPYKAAGPDNISPRVLKELSQEIAPILTSIFNLSLDTGTIPDDWQKANVSPIYKKGNKYDPANYRPISLTCICCKLLEHIVTSNIMKHGEENNILYPLQHGFRKGRSCETQLLEFTDDITNSLESGQQTDVLVMDFSKAFDKVHHSLLLHKLNHYGIRGRTHRWIQAFLSNRTQKVVLEGVSSDTVSVDSGVPQGSVLGPSLFLFYINDIPNGINSTVRLFADDTIVYLAITGDTDCINLQEDLNKLAAWEDKWKMEFHPLKCQVISLSRKRNTINYKYKLHDHILDHVKSVKYLGCTINDKLDWGEHINNICNKANRNLNFVRRNLNIASTSIKQVAFKSLVRPTVEYASTVWDPYEKGDIDKLEMVQRSGARYVKNRYHNRSSVSDMLSDLQWKSLQDRRREARLTMLYKIVNSKVAIPTDHRLSQNTTKSDPANNIYFFHIPFCRTLYRQKSFSPRTIRDWNSLPADVMSARSVDAFRSQLAKHFI